NRIDKCDLGSPDVAWPKIMGDNGHKQVQGKQDKRQKSKQSPDDRRVLWVATEPICKRHDNGAKQQKRYPLHGSTLVNGLYQTVLEDCRQDMPGASLHMLDMSECISTASDFTAKLYSPA